jgi:hypothetical protein
MLYVLREGTIETRVISVVQPFAVYYKESFGLISVVLSRRW